jgi:hypothetical protein
MKKSRSLILIAVGAVLAGDALYDASMLTRFGGLPIDGGEAIVALVALSLSMVSFVLGGLGLRNSGETA